MEKLKGILDITKKIKWMEKDIMKFKKYVG